MLNTPLNSRKSILRASARRPTRGRASAAPGARTRRTTDGRRPPRAPPFLPSLLACLQRNNPPCRDNELTLDRQPPRDQIERAHNTAATNAAAVGNQVK
jgi:hypothetical protein